MFARIGRVRRAAGIAGATAGVIALNLTIESHGGDHQALTAPAHGMPSCSRGLESWRQQQHQLNRVAEACGRDGSLLPVTRRSSESAPSHPSPRTSRRAASQGLSSKSMPPPVCTRSARRRLRCSERAEPGPLGLRADPNGQTQTEPRIGAASGRGTYMVTLSPISASRAVGGVPTPARHEDRDIESPAAYRLVVAPR